MMNRPSQRTAESKLADVSLTNYAQTCKRSRVYINSNIWKFNLFMESMVNCWESLSSIALLRRARFVFLVGMSQICAAHHPSKESHDGQWPWAQLKWDEWPSEGTTELFLFFLPGLVTSRGATQHCRQQILRNIYNSSPWPQLLIWVFCFSPILPLSLVFCLLFV